MEDLKLFVWTRLSIIKSARTRLHTASLARALCLITAFAAIPLLAISQPVSAAEDSSERLSKVSKDITQLKSLLDTIKKERSQLESRLEMSEKDIVFIQSNLKKNQKQLDEALAEEKKQQAQRQQLRQQQAREQAVVAQAIEAAYIAGHSPQLKMMLNQENPDQISRMMAYYDHFANVQAQALKALEESDRKLAANEKQLVRSREYIVQRRQSLTQQVSRLKKGSLERQQLLVSLQNKESTHNSRLTRLEKERKELQLLLDSIISISDIQDVSQPFSKELGKMIWPVRGKIIHSFGQKRQNTTMDWNGIFIQAKAGAPVKAPHHGRVVFADWMKSFGQLLILDHGHSYMTLYAHNESLLKTEGDWVSPGDVISYVGDSGGQSQTGLYFEIRHKGRPSNPRRWLAR